MDPSDDQHDDDLFADLYVSFSLFLVLS
jgi:hypothetical protein